MGFSTPTVKCTQTKSVGMRFRVQKNRIGSRITILNAIQKRSKISMLNQATNPNTW